MHLMDVQVIKKAISELQEDVHKNALEHGWHDEERSFGDIIALCHSELSEALEGFREGNKPDKHCPTFNNVEIELADCVIRIMDYCGSVGIDLASAILAKHEVNKNRPYRHGNKVI